MSIDAGVSIIGSKGLAMATQAGEENPNEQPLEANGAKLPTDRERGRYG